MEEEDILIDLSNGSLAALVAAVNDLLTGIKNNQLTEEFSLKIYHPITKLVKHSHIKVKLGALQVLNYIYDLCIGKITDPQVPLLPLMQMFPKSQNPIKGLIWTAIKHILSSDRAKWVEIVENFLFKTNSVEEKCLILDVLIPLAPILSLDCLLHLLEDTSYDVAERAQKMIQYYNNEEIVYIVSKIYLSNKMPPRNKERLLAASKEIYERAKAAQQQKKVAKKPKEAPKYVKDVLEFTRVEDDDETAAANNSTGRRSRSPSPSRGRQNAIDGDDDDDNRTNNSKSSRRRSSLYNNNNNNNNSSGSSGRNFFSSNDEFKEGGRGSRRSRSPMSTRSPLSTQSMKTIPSPRRSLGSPIANSARSSRKDLYPDADIYEKHYPGTPVQETVITSVGSPETDSIVISGGEFGNTSLIDSEDFAEEEFPEEFNETYNQHYVQTEELPINLRNLANHPWMERCAYIEVFQEALDLYQMKEPQYQAIFESCLQAAYPLHPKVSQSLSHFCSTMILFHPEAVDPNIHALFEFALSGALVINSEEETIAAICQEVDPKVALESAINILDEKPKTGFFAIQFIILLLEMNENVSLERLYVSRACSYCLHQAKTPEEQRYSSHLFSLFGSKMPEQFISFVQSQPMEYTQTLAPYIQKPSKPTQNASSTTQQSKESRRTSRIKLDPKTAMEIITQELSKKENCNLMNLENAFSQVRIANFSHLTLIFHKFLKVVNSMDPEQIREDSESVKSICRMKFKDPRLLQFLREEPQIELIRGLSKISYLSTVKLFKGSSEYAEPLYQVFSKASGNDRRAIAVLFVAMKKVDEYDVRQSDFVSKQHLRVIDALMGEFEL